MECQKSPDVSEAVQGSWWRLKVMKKAKAKIKKVIKGLKKASNSHKKQAKALTKAIGGK